MKKLISVTQADIRRGVRGSFLECPVALALNKATNSFWEVDTCGMFYGMTKAKTLPRAVKRFLNRFDRNGKSAVKPFRFWLEY